MVKDETSVTSTAINPIFNECDSQISQQNTKNSHFHGIAKFCSDHLISAKQQKSAHSWKIMHGKHKRIVLQSIINPNP